MTVRRWLPGLAAGVLALTLGLDPDPARADADEIRIARQYGLGYLQLMMMEHEHLFEKQAKALGFGDLKARWVTLGGGSVANDALLSGSVDIIGGGIGAFVTLWEKTRGSLAVKSPGALASFPMLLNSDNPAVKSIRDLTDKDKIALPAIKISPQAVTLQAAAAKVWGFDQYARLDHLTVSLPHPEAMQALTSGKSEITAHFTTPPFMNLELKDPAIHTILNSFDVWGPQTATITWTTSKFANENPRLMQAFVAALAEATKRINADKRKAAELYVAMAKEKGGVEEVYPMLADPQMKFTTIPENITGFTDFKFKTGTMKVKPESWKDLFFTNVWDEAGS
jgi:NitT/TauT family transport system substrate-binding protein